MNGNEKRRYGRGLSGMVGIGRGDTLDHRPQVVEQQDTQQSWRDTAPRHVHRMGNPGAVFANGGDLPAPVALGDAATRRAKSRRNPRSLCGIHLASACVLQEVTTGRPHLMCLLALALWTLSPIARAATGVSGSGEAGALTTDASLRVDLSDASWTLFVETQFQGLAGIPIPNLAPTLVMPFGLEAATGPLGLAGALTLPALGEVTTLQMAVDYTLDEAVSISAEASAPVAELDSPAWALWVNLRLSDHASTSCGGGRDIRPNTVDSPELLLVCLASLEN